MKQNQLLYIILLGLLLSCETPQTDTLFHLLSAEKTGIDFTNQLAYDADFNV